MRIRTMASALAAMAMTTGAIAQEPPVRKPPSEKKMCRADAETGSILAHRRCYTRAQWAEIDRESAQRNAKDVGRFSDAVRRPDGTGLNR